jgi:hypothetical protein
VLVFQCDAVATVLDLDAHALRCEVMGRKDQRHINVHLSTRRGKPTRGHTRSGEAKNNLMMIGGCSLEGITDKITDDLTQFLFIDVQVEVEQRTSGVLCCAVNIELHPHRPGLDLK